MFVCLLIDTGRTAGKGLIHPAACKQRQYGPPSLSFLLVGNNTDNTGAKDTPDQCNSKAFYTPNQTLALYVCVWQPVHEHVKFQHSGKQRAPLWPTGWVGAGDSACMQNCCGIIAPSLSRTGGYSSQARGGDGRSSVMETEEEGGGMLGGFQLFSLRL